MNLKEFSPPLAINPISSYDAPMKKPAFDPNAISPKNGCFLGLDYSLEESPIAIVQAPWDVTTSYRPGTVYGPEAVIEASYQLDMYSHHTETAWNTKIATLPLKKQWKQLSVTLRSEAEKIISSLEKGIPEDDDKIQKMLQTVFEKGKDFHEGLYEDVSGLLKMGKKVITLGGDHSVSLGPIKAHQEKYPDMSILHIDAHADLRKAYEGFTHSHASIMYNVMEKIKIKKLVQVGVRDVSATEISYIEKSDRIKTFFDWTITDKLYAGTTWDQIADQIVAELSPQVYISFDIDGLDPKLCPNTGTPVPGGLELSQITHLFLKLKKSGKKVVGGDLVEVAPSPKGDEWDGNVGARALWQMCLAL